MKMSTDANERLNSLLIALFDEMTRKRPDIWTEIPDKAVLVMQLRGNKQFNNWAKEIASDEDAKLPRVFVEFALKADVKPTTAKKLSWKQIEAMELQPA